MTELVWIGFLALFLSLLFLDLKLTARDLLPVQKDKDVVDDMP